MITENGTQRHTLTRKQLEETYKCLDNYIADCTESEAKANKEHFIAIKTLIHKHIQEAK